jgi:hypothetical protein
VVGHDDLEMYERAQRGLHARGKSARRNSITDGTSESQVRKQFRALAKS